MRQPSTPRLRALTVAAFLALAASCGKAPVAEAPFEPYVPSRARPTTTTAAPVPDTSPPGVSETTAPAELARTIPEAPADWRTVADRKGEFTISVPPNWLTVPTGFDATHEIWAMDLPKSIADAWPILTDDKLRAFAYEPVLDGEFQLSLNVVVVDAPLDPKLAVVPAITMETELKQVLGAIDPQNLTMSRYLHPGSASGWVIRAEYDAAGGHFVQYLVPFGSGAAVVTLTTATARPELEAIPASFRSA